MGLPRQAVTLTRIASVPVRVPRHLGPVWHGRMTDAVSCANCRERCLGRSAAIRLHGGKVSVKPLAQPTLVRTQHLPPPAKTDRELGIPRPRGPSCVVSSCVIAGQEPSLHHDVYGHIADGFGAGGAVHRPVCVPVPPGLQGSLGGVLLPSGKVEGWHPCCAHPPTAT